MDVLAIAITAGVSCLVTTSIGIVIGVFRERLKQIHEKNTALEEGMKYMLKDSIHERCEHRIEKGYCSLRSKKVISDMFSIYTRLGGNDFVHEEVDETMKLPSTNK